MSIIQTKLKQAKQNEELSKKELLQLFLSTRQFTEELCRPLETEDYVVQTTDDVSPPKWHLAHTSWYFEAFVLLKYMPDYKIFNELFSYIFNSYYESVGDRASRPRRGTLSRPTVKEIYNYRKYVNDKMLELVEQVDDKIFPECYSLIELGINHEQQHQELLVTDIKNIFANNPIKPVYYKSDLNFDLSKKSTPAKFIDFQGGVCEIGYKSTDFSFDNERPKHKVFLDDFKLQNRLTTNSEYLEFINDGGYSNYIYWLSDGWDLVNRNNWKCPLYWEKIDNEWYTMTLNGFQRLNLTEPVCHISFYEADAYAKWAKKRLPTEAEWEVAANISKPNKVGSNLLEKKTFHPQTCMIPQDPKCLLSQLFGNVWEWTNSAYLPYPGYKQPVGLLGEYNGKFMSNQMILKGGSCATPQDHIRITYRNFFQPDKRWQFTGVRLASNVE